MKEAIKLIIDYTKNWNDGNGLVLSEAVAKKLKKMGIKKGYTVDKKLTQ